MNPRSVVSISQNFPTLDVERCQWYLENRGIGRLRSHDSPATATEFFRADINNCRNTILVDMTRIST